MSTGGHSSPTEQDDEFLDNEILDLDVFNQLLSMDDADDDGYEFSQDIVFDYFEQAKTTFADMDKALLAKDLAKLSSLGHFLKGSSATIGVKKVQDSCKHIQYLGKMQGRNGEGSVGQDEALRLIGQELKSGKAEFRKAEEFLRLFYEQADDDDDDDDDNSSDN